MKITVEGWGSWSPEEEMSEKPKLAHFKNVMKRRMSQLSKMVAQVGHDILEEADTEIDDIVFASSRGEISRQLDITNRLLAEGEVSPSEFGYSVFNAPAALLSLIEKVKGSSRALCSGSESFVQGLVQTVLQIKSGRTKRVLFLYAEELVPEYYNEIHSGTGTPRILGLILSSEKDNNNALFSLTLKPENSMGESESGFNALYKWLKLGMRENLPVLKSNGSVLYIE